VKFHTCLLYVHIYAKLPPNITRLSLETRQIHATHSSSEFVYFTRKKSQHFWNDMTNLHRIWHVMGNMSLVCKAVKNFNFKNPRWRTAAILTSKNRDKIYVTMMQRKRIGCPPSWVFKINFFNCRCTCEPILRHYAKYRRDRLECCRDQISRYFAIVFFLAKCANSLDGHA